MQIYSPGHRNTYDIVITKTPGKAGRMYSIDNGANQGWGGYPQNEGTNKVNNNYVSIGSGSTYARLVLTQQDRLYSIINSKLSDLSTENNVGIAAYIINEVKQLDLETGGKTQVAIVDRDGYR